MRIRNAIPKRMIESLVINILTLSRILLANKTKTIIPPKRIEYFDKKDITSLLNPNPRIFPRMLPFEIDMVMKQRAMKGLTIEIKIRILNNVKSNNFSVENSRTKFAIKTPTAMMNKTFMANNRLGLANFPVLNLSVIIWIFFYQLNQL